MTERFVVVALVVEAFEAKSEEKMFWALQVFAEYVFGMVVEESMKYIADVVDHESPAAEKYVAEVVEKKLLTFFHASAEVVDHERPTEVK